MEAGQRSQAAAGRGGATEQTRAIPGQDTGPAATGGGDEPACLGELEKLGELRDKGIITEEEFEAKKKQLLGL